MRKTRAGSQWRAAFLRALEQGRSVGAAAAAAGVHYQSPFNLKRRDPDFAAAWSAAAAAGQGRLAGRTLALAADEVVGRSKTGPCIKKAGATRWSAGKERRFLDELATSANVARAVAATGLSRTAVMGRRRENPDFAERWDAALRQGWACVEAALVRAAGVTLGGLPADETEDEATVRLTAGEAIGAYRDYLRAQAGDPRRRPGPRPAEPPIEEVRAEILRRVRAIRGG